jgi:hypothetical protein
MTLNPQVLLDVGIYLGGADMTGYSNKIAQSAEVETLDRTTFLPASDPMFGWRRRTGGVRDTSFELEGFFEAADLSKPDDSLWAGLGTATLPLTTFPEGGASGDLAYVSRVLETEYKPGGSHGALLAWSAACKGNWPVARGKILHPNGTARTSSGDGTPYQLGAVAADEALYVGLHVISVSNTVSPSLTVAIESDSTNSFSGAETVRGTMAAATAISGQALRIAGAITDTWWRATWTISGASASFLFAVSAGIGPK